MIKGAPANAHRQIEALWHIPGGQQHGCSVVVTVPLPRGSYQSIARPNAQHRRKQNPNNSRLPDQPVERQANIGRESIGHTGRGRAGGTMSRSKPA